ncbi:hypothetical protein [Legionella maioricensis]|uniref:Uncharacterized protein n=1 Tax=Legionella maioricensis TaxID=2896528 RepID=A0A9X2D1F4_9GAMM|nr:hypothetical protein [Legionella maioricensis]MCL9684865.1 hypothetical protein [Legionella maioricensis]MCL9688941.1 hypothetical protein [Legionella maioricensis]
MPLLKDVIAQFKSSFQYLDAENRRKTFWYEFWLNDFTKELLTNTKLTTELEQAAKKCVEQLDELSGQHIEEPFASHQDAFFKIIVATLRTVQLQRFKSGTEKTENYQKDQHYVMERILYPKKEGLFEEQLINGLNSVKETFPELSSIMEQKILHIVEAKPKPFVLFHENMKFGDNGNKFFTTDGRTRTIEDVTDAVDEQLKHV